MKKKLINRLLFFCLLFLNVTIPADPIDIVYTWVDGGDFEWQAIKEFHIAAAVKRAFAVGSYSDYDDSQNRRDFLDKMAFLFDSATQNRFADNQELRYSLRSVLQYAPFVNHIYIVTMNQRPSWLADHPKITVIDHKDIFKDHKDLPTFNSHAIESNLHRIPGLSEHFIYLNDDVFFGACVTPEDFFVGDKVNVLFEKGLSPSGEPLPHETAYRKAWRNTNAFLDAHFKTEPRKRLRHTPFALRKSYIEDFEEKFPEIFAINSSHKFRSEKDFNVTNGLLHYYWSYHHKIVSRSYKNGQTNNMMISFRNDENLERTVRQLEKLENRWPVTFGLEDLMDENSTRARMLLHDFLERHFPEPAPWELN